MRNIIFQYLPFTHHYKYDIIFTVEREMLISVAIGAAIVALLVFILFRILWRNLSQTLGIVAVSLFVFGWWREGCITPVYCAASVGLIVLALGVKVRRKRQYHRQLKELDDECERELDEFERRMAEDDDDLADN